MWMAEYYGNWYIVVRSVGHVEETYGEKVGTVPVVKFRELTAAQELAARLNGEHA